jgi:SAM-dependent methyltransferase
MNSSLPIDAEVDRLDPYAFMAVVGKRVIHPGGRRSTHQMLELAGLAPGQRVIDVGCGVATTAIEVARRFGCHVTAVDIDPLMLTRASANVRASGVDTVLVAKADIQALEFADQTFDRVLIEAVTMFVDRRLAVREVVRVCRPGGRVLDHEFIYRRPPTAEIRRIFEGEVCPGIRFDTAADWLALYQSAGLNSLQQRTGPFSMMTPWGMLRDEGIRNLLAMLARVAARRAYRRKMIWLMSRMVRVLPYLGYVVLVGTKPTDDASRTA